MLADFVVHISATSSEVDGITALELGAGTGEIDGVLKLLLILFFLVAQWIKYSTAWDESPSDGLNCP